MSRYSLVEQAFLPVEPVRLEPGDRGVLWYLAHDGEVYGVQAELRHINDDSHEASFQAAVVDPSLPSHVMATTSWAWRPDHLKR